LLLNESIFVAASAVPRGRGLRPEFLGEKTVTAYFIAIRNAITDPQELTIYREKVRSTFEGHPVKPLTRYGKVRCTDGKAIEGAVILEFPTFEDAEAWYDSAAYQAIVGHRFKGGDYQTFIVEGA
jgi:uncharacterized protein (DUF1330 family)